MEVDVTNIVAAIIGFLGVALTVYGTSRNTQHKIDTENQIQNQKIDKLSEDIKTVKEEITENMRADQKLTETKFSFINTEMQEMKADIKSHNNYAKMFAESLPVFKEQMSVANHRIADLESDVNELKNKRGE